MRARAWDSQSNELFAVVYSSSSSRPAAEMALSFSLSIFIFVLIFSLYLHWVCHSLLSSSWMNDLCVSWVFRSWFLFHHIISVAQTVQLGLQHQAHGFDSQGMHALIQCHFDLACMWWSHKPPSFAFDCPLACISICVCCLMRCCCVQWCCILCVVFVLQQYCGSAV